MTAKPANPSGSAKAKITRARKPTVGPVVGAHITDLQPIIQHQALTPSGMLTGMVEADTLPALSSKALFWRPRYAVVSPALVHLPFLFWLTEVVKPRMAVQLGLQDGVGFLALCQAIDKLALEATCVGINPDPDRPPLPAAAAEQHEALYTDFSFLVSEDTAKASRHIHKVMIDLLVIEAKAANGFADVLRSHWLSRLSETAVIVVHNLDTIADADAGAFFAEMEKACPSLHFRAEGGNLDVFLLGRKPAPRILALAELEAGMPQYLATRQVFTRLGQGLLHDQQARQHINSLKTTQAGLLETAQILADTQSELQTHRNDNVLLRRAMSEQAEILATQQMQLLAADANSTKVKELEAALAEAQDNAITTVAAHSSELDDLNVQLARSDRQHLNDLSKLEKLTAEKASLEAALAKAQDKAKTAAAHAADLSKIAEAHGRDIEDRNVQLAQSDRQHLNDLSKLEKLTAEKASLEAALAQAQDKAKTAAAHAADLSKMAEAHGRDIEDRNVQLAQSDRQHLNDLSKLEKLTAEKASLEAALAEAQSTLDEVIASAGHEIAALRKQL